jgi:hypothetical protein
MTILDKAKFLLIPSGYKATKLYSIFPSAGGFDFTFARVGDDATRQNVSGIIETKAANIPRLNHHNNGCPSLLIEETRSNLQIRSEEFENSAWTTDALAVTVTANQITSPKGTTTADKILRTATSAAYIRDAAAKPSAATMQMTTSVFVKQGEGDYFALRAQGVYPNRVDARFRFSTKQIYQYDAFGTFTAGRTKVEEYGDGWFRLQIEYTTDAVVDGTNSTSTSFVYLFGCQVEKGVGATSYVKTEDIAVSRNFDDCINTSTFTLGADATFYLDFKINSYDDNFIDLLSIKNSNSSKTLRLRSYKSGTNYFVLILATSNNGSSNTLITTSENLIPFFQQNKLAVRLFGNEFLIFLNGSQIKTGTVTGNFDVLNGEAIASDFGIANGKLNGDVFTHAIFDETLTTSELTTLTTL